MKRKLITSAACILFGFAATYGQADTTKNNSYEGLSLKDLLDIKIVSASKKSESLFDAPLSASVVTKEQIQQAGCTSIMEALRLVPGMIVREQTNGNFDVQLRGVYTTPNTWFDGNSVTSLVMIDNRPIFNYLKGGTFWETLPVDLNDVERIEVVRGPSGALYGPNAVTGVINIITRQATEKGLYVVASSRQGSYKTFINNASLGFKGKKWGVIASGNFQQRDRTGSSYYEIFRNEWLTHPDYLVTFIGDTVHNVENIYPHDHAAMEKYAGNIFAHYNPTAKIKLDLSAGIQHSFVQKVQAENGATSLTSAASDSRYADLRAGLGALSAQLSYLEGTQAPDHQPGNKYDFSTIDATVEYNFTKGNFSLKPGLSYRRALYDDTKYSDPVTKNGIFNARGEIITKSASLRGEYTLLNKKLRLVAGLTSNTFNYPDETYLSKEFAATYKLNKNHLIRGVYSESPRSSTIYDTYVDQIVTMYPSGFQKQTVLRLEGNRNLQMLHAGMLEFGYRGSISPDLDVEVELFRTHSKNYSMMVVNKTYTEVEGLDTLEIIPLRATNIPMVNTQHGITVSLAYAAGRLRFKPFITLQETVVKNYTPYAATPDASYGFVQQDPLLYNIYSGIGQRQVYRASPKIFGGFSATYEISEKLHANTNAYYYSAYTFSHVSSTLFNDGERGIDHIPAKLIINANITYEPIPGLELVLSGKNLLNDRSREYFKTDPVPFQLLGGIRYEF